jgi:Holliday junction resolvase RusA-like endonuclease
MRFVDITSAQAHWRMMPPVERNISIELPKYGSDARVWKEQIQAKARAALADAGFMYSIKDRLEVEMTFFMRGGLARRDVDNSVKQVLDALKGAKGIFPDDNQVYRIIAEKRRLPKDRPKTDGGRLMVRLHEEH